MTTIRELRASGAFRSGKPVEKEIRFKLDDDTEHVATIYVKRLSIGETERAFIEAAGADLSRAAKIISEVVSLGKDGAERIPIGDADKLHPSLAKAMLDAVTQVNGKKAKN
jgi:hypothetical protein